MRSMFKVITTRFAVVWRSGVGNVLLYSALGIVLLLLVVDGLYKALGSGNSMLGQIWVAEAVGGVGLVFLAELLYRILEQE